MILAEGATNDSSAGIDWVLFWTVVAAVVGALALIGVAFTILQYYRDHPKRRIEWDYSSRKLMAEDLKPEEFEVTVRGVQVRDPHITDLVLYSNSRADIPSSSFDGGKAIRIRIEPGHPIFLNDGATRGEIFTTGATADGERWAELEIGPQLIRKRTSFSASFVTSGLPSVALPDWPVIDVEPRKVDLAARAELMRSVLVDWAPAIPGGSVLASLVSLFASARRERTGSVR